MDFVVIYEFLLVRISKRKGRGGGGEDIYRDRRGTIRSHSAKHQLWYQLSPLEVSPFFFSN